MTDSTLTMNPAGGAKVRRGDTEPALHVELMQRIGARFQWVTLGTHYVSVCK